MLKYTLFLFSFPVAIVRFTLARSLSLHAPPQITDSGDARPCAGSMDPSVLATMDRDALKKQIENMKYQATMERWPLSKSIAA